MTLSLAMIVKDEEASIETVLNDVAAICDEIVVLDTGSTDRTMELARQCGASVYEFSWVDDFAAARNVAFSHCTSEWILWLDADDRVSPYSRDILREIHDEVIGRQDIDVVVLPYRYSFSQEDPDTPVLVLMRERMIRRDAGLRWRGELHEVIGVDFSRAITRSDAVIDHRPDPAKQEGKRERNFHIAEKAVQRGARSARALESYARELAAKENYGEAKKYYEQVLKDVGTESRYIVLLEYARVYNWLGDFERYVEIIVEAILFDSTRAEAFGELGASFFNRNEWSRAAPLFAAATVLELPQNNLDGLFPPAYSWWSWDYLCLCAVAMGDSEFALHCARKALDNTPELDRLLQTIERIIDGWSIQTIEEFDETQYHSQTAKPMLSF